MTGASKILTVSYGTFSCTLEGFDEPFNTMKAIAEYFRDLAADDRYFGAEPPTPDAAMLHRIAEREIQRRVEAKIQDNGVILRAGEGAEPDALPVPVVLPAAPTLADANAEGVAARLQRIRARHVSQAQVAEAEAVAATTLAEPVVDQGVSASAPLATPPLGTESYTEDEHADDLLDAGHVAPTVHTEDAVIDISDQLERILDAAEADHEVQLAAPVAPIIDLSDEFADLPEAEDFDIASVVATPDRVATSEPELPSAEDSLLASIADELVEVASAPVAHDAGTAAVSLVVNSGTRETDEGELLSRLSELEIALPVEPTVEPVDLAPADLAPADLEPAELAPETQAEDADALADLDEELIAEIDHIGATPTAPVADLPSADLQPEDEVARVEETTAPEPVNPQRARARVIRIRRSEVPEQAAAQESVPEVPPASALSDDAEAALQAELAALEAELGYESAPAPVEVAENAAPEPTASEENPAAPIAEPTGSNLITTRRHAAPPSEDESIKRLMDQAETEMGGEETRRRQSAIAHLKAAVAATAAERGNDESSTGADSRMAAYRSDLDRVVRPRRPTGDGSSTARPEAASEAPHRPTPLVLVSAQRIDRKPTPSANQTAAETGPRVVMPVRPRRVSPVSAQASVDTVMQGSDQDEIEIEIAEFVTSGEAGNVFADATSFQDFADQLGASALPDLLEAAAVYCAEVLQRPEFSRPLVMRQISALPGQTQTAREDYLRGFGTLLRQGRIAKVKRGMFALTDRSPYLAEARKLAG